MPKKAKKTNSNCEDHLFSLKPKQNFCRFNQAASISFCDQLKDRNRTKTKKCKNSSCLDGPVFNKDKNFATPTFILNSQKQYYEERGQKMREEHQKKMVEYTDEKDSLNVPKPRTKNNFCSVCRQVYEDYLQHIQSQRHKKKINTSHFNRYILDIAEKFNPNSKNLFNYSHHTLSTGIQDDVEIVQKPKKKIKIDNNFNQRYQSYQEMIKPYIPPPPPHLDLNHSGYFPRFSSQIGLMPNNMPVMPPIPYNQPLNNPYNLNYNMSFFINQYGYNNFYPQPYNLFNSIMQYGQNPMNNTLINPIMNPMINPMVNPMLNPMPYQRAQHNYHFAQQQSNHPNINKQIHNQHEIDRSSYHGNMMNPNQYNFKKECKKQMYHKQKSQIIVIDDDDYHYPNEVYCKNE